MLSFSVYQHFYLTFSSFLTLPIMAILKPAVPTSDLAEAADIPFLQTDTVVDGAVDYKSRPVTRPRFGGWRSASFIIAVEVLERIAFFGIGSNLISYLTGPLGQPTAAAAVNVNAWAGTSFLLPLFGAVVGDSILGRFRTVVASSFVYILGLGMLTLSTSLTISNPLNCNTTSASTKPCGGPTKTQVLLFFFSLYTVAVGQSGHKPSLQAFGADQFDDKDPEERMAKSSFFNWLHFCTSTGLLMVLCILQYIQDNLNWALGFGIPCIMMVISLLVFLLGTPTYRYLGKVQKESQYFSRVSSPTTERNCSARSSQINVDLEDKRILPRYENETLLFTKDRKEDENVSISTDIEQKNSMFPLFPIWATSLAYAIVVAQSFTLFTKQGVTMDRSIAPNLTIPAAALQSFMGLSTVCFLFIYEFVFVPMARRVTGEPAGIKQLHRIAVGIFISMISMAISAIVEAKRLKVAHDHGLIDSPHSTVPMKVWWLVPQYVLIGLANVFALVGLQEFFYDQAHAELRSLGISLSLSVLGIGSLLSGLIISIIGKATARDGRGGWFSDNLNRAHLDFFYCFLAGLAGVSLLLFVVYSRSYV